MNEYQMLREELNSKMDKQDQLTQFCYTIAAAIWSIAFAAKNEWILLPVLFLVIPISLRIVKLRNDTAFLAAYMAIFLEKNIDIKWESNSSIFWKEYPREKQQGIFYVFSKFDFIFIVTITSVLFWLMRFDNFIIRNWILTVLVILCQVFILILEIFVIKKFSNFSADKEKYRR